MSVPRWARWLVRRCAPRDRIDDVLGDLEEAHRRRLERRGRVIGVALTSVEALDVSMALLRQRLFRRKARRVDRALPPSGGGRLGRPGFSWVDVKLGVRMLVRYPGLTIVGCVAMAFAIWVGATVFEFAMQMVFPTLPLDEGDRVVALRMRDLETGHDVIASLHDFVVWRDELDAVEDLSAFRTTVRNLIVRDGSGAPERIAEITASGFRLARVPPLLGRSLLEADERPSAEPVVVIGYDLWRRLFGGDPDVVGRSVRLGRDEHTVIGVMPEGFGFPISQQLWAPLRLNPLDYGPGESPSVGILGRLVPDVTLEQAQAELTTLGVNAAAADPQTYAHLRPEAVAYAHMLFEPERIARAALVAGVLSSANLFVVALIALLCGNVALLLFARAATREDEIAVRSALGASRGRIVGQLFAEALVLGVIAGAIGLGAARYGVRWVLSVVQAEVLEGSPLPFWVHDSLSTSTIVYAMGLTVLAALVAGALPALKITGRGAIDRLRRLGAGGGGATLGHLWSAGLILQVAATVVFVAVTYEVRRDASRQRDIDSGFVGDDFLTAHVQLDREPPPGVEAETPEQFQERYRQTIVELEERLRTDPAVAAVTFADRLPRMYHPWNQVEVEGGMAPAPDERGHRLGRANVEPGFFHALGVPLLMGRTFDDADVGSDHLVVIVNESFVERVLGGRNPIGRRLRFIASEEVRVSPEDPGPWYEIVGVVQDLARMSGYGKTGVFHPVAPGGVYGGHLAMRVRGDPLAYASRLSAAAFAVDPTARLDDVLRLDQVDPGTVIFYRFWFRLSTAMSVIVLMLSLSAIYAVTSYAVSRRTREIGIRVALGSGRRRILYAVLKRPVLEVSLGVALAMLAIGSVAATGFNVQGLEAYVRVGAWLAAYALFMMVVCMLACVVPTRRALGIEPSEALRADG